MFFLKNVEYNYIDQRVEIENGIRCCLINNTLNICSSFWGQSEIWGNDKSKLIKTKDKNIQLLPFVNEIKVKEDIDGYKNILFNVALYDENNIEGYVIFIEHGQNIETNGEKLFSRYIGNEIITILREGQFVKFDNNQLVVNNNELFLKI